MISLSSSAIERDSSSLRSRLHLQRAENNFPAPYLGWVSAPYLGRAHRWSRRRSSCMSCMGFLRGRARRWRRPRSSCMGFFCGRAHRGRRPRSSCICFLRGRARRWRCRRSSCATPLIFDTCYFHSLFLVVVRTLLFDPRPVAHRVGGEEAGSERGAFGERHEL